MGEETQILEDQNVIPKHIVVSLTIEVVALSTPYWICCIILCIVFGLQLFKWIRLVVEKNNCPTEIMCLNQEFVELPSK